METSLKKNRYLLERRGKDIPERWKRHVIGRVKRIESKKIVESNFLKALYVAVIGMKFIL